MKKSVDPCPRFIGSKTARATSGIPDAAQGQPHDVVDVSRQGLHRAVGHGDVEYVELLAMQGTKRSPTQAHALLKIAAGGGAGACSERAVVEADAPAAVGPAAWNSTTAAPGNVATPIFPIDDGVFRTAFKVGQLSSRIVSKNAAVATIERGRPVVARHCQIMASRQNKLARTAGKKVAIT